MTWLKGLLCPPAICFIPLYHAAILCFLNTQSFPLIPVKTHLYVWTARRRCASETASKKLKRQKKLMPAKLVFITVHQIIWIFNRRNLKSVKCLLSANYSLDFRRRRSCIDSAASSAHSRPKAWRFIVSLTIPYFPCKNAKKTRHNEFEQNINNTKKKHIILQ